MYVNNLSPQIHRNWWPGSTDSDLPWTVEIFTVDNVFDLDPSAMTSDGTRLHSATRQWLGGRRSLSRDVEVTLVETPEQTTTWRTSPVADEVIKRVKLLFRHPPDDAANAGWWGATTADGAERKHIPVEPVLMTYPWVDSQTPWVAAGERHWVALIVTLPMLFLRFPKTVMNGATAGAVRG